MHHRSIEMHSGNQYYSYRGFSSILLNYTPRGLSFFNIDRTNFSKPDSWLRQKVFLGVWLSALKNHYSKNYVIFENFKILHIFHKYLNSEINILAFLIFLNVLKPDELKKSKVWFIQTQRMQRRLGGFEGFAPRINKKK